MERPRCERLVACHCTVLLVVWRVVGSNPFQAQVLHLRSLATTVISSPKHRAVLPVPEPVHVSSTHLTWNTCSNWQLAAVIQDNYSCLRAPAECAASLSKLFIVHAGCVAVGATCVLPADAPAKAVHLPVPAGCAASLTKLAQADSRTAQQSVFSEFGRAVLNSLIYLLKDSLERLQDVHSIEKSKQDIEAWQRQPPG